MLGIFSDIISLSSADLFFSKLVLFLKGHYQSVGPDLGPNCLLRLSADDKICR